MLLIFLLLVFYMKVTSTAGSAQLAALFVALQPIMRPATAHSVPSIQSRLVLSDILVAVVAEKISAGILTLRDPVTVSYTDDHWFPTFSSCKCSADMFLSA